MKLFLIDLQCVVQLTITKWADQSDECLLYANKIVRVAVLAVNNCMCNASGNRNNP